MAGAPSPTDGPASVPARKLEEVTQSNPASGMIRSNLRQVAVRMKRCLIRVISGAPINNSTHLAQIRAAFSWIPMKPDPERARGKPEDGFPIACVRFIGSEPKIESRAVQEVVLVAVAVCLAQARYKDRLEPRQVVVKLDRPERQPMVDR